MRIAYHCGSINGQCEQYYQNQAGSGLPVFIGSHGQRGHGLFSSLLRHAIPFLKKAGIGVGKQLLRSGTDIITDLESGHTFKDSLKRRGSEMPGQFINSMRGGGATRARKGVKRRRKTRKHVKTPKTQKKRTTKDRQQRRRKLCKKRKRKNTQGSINFF